MKNESFVDTIKPKDLKGTLRRIKRRINGLNNNSIQSLNLIPSDENVRKIIDAMSLAELIQAKIDVEARLRKESAH